MSLRNQPLGCLWAPFGRPLGSLWPKGDPRWPKGGKSADIMVNTSKIKLFGTRPELPDLADSPDLPDLAETVAETAAPNPPFHTRRGPG